MNLIRRAVFFSVLAAFPAFSQTAATPTQAPAQPPAQAPAKAATPSPTPSPYSREATLSESGGMVHVAANNPRPLAQVLDALREKYKWVVSYEDPQFTAQQDLITTPGGDSHMQIAGGNFTAEFSATAPDEEKTLRAIVDAYNHSKNPGRFEVRKTAEGRFYVVGTAATDDKGKISPQQVLFDLPITIPAEDRTITDTLNLICKELSTRSKLQVLLGVSPRGLMEHTNVKIGGNAVAARDLMLQSIAGIKTHPYWQMLFDPNSKTYYLQLHSPRV